MPGFTTKYPFEGRTFYSVNPDGFAKKDIVSSGGFFDVVLVI